MQLYNEHGELNLFLYSCGDFFLIKNDSDFTAFTTILFIYLIVCGPSNWLPFSLVVSIAGWKPAVQDWVNRIFVE